MIMLAHIYLLAGLIFAAFAGLGLRDGSNPRRIPTSAFWALLAVSMLAGDQLGDFGNGLLVLAMVALAAFGGLARGTAGDVPEKERSALAGRYGNGLFVVALIIPATALFGTVMFKAFPEWVEAKQSTLISLALGVLIALCAGMAWLRPTPTLPLQQGRRLLDQVGWAAILPQMLASLGAVFALAGVGDVVGKLMGGIIPAGSLFGAVLAFTTGMALFTIVMGNAFAAFPVMISAVGLPLLIREYHGNPAIICAIGMLAGFCGTLMTPMAANFNLVPAALLNLKDRYGVIRAQLATAFPLFLVNTILIWWLAFR